MSSLFSRNPEEKKPAPAHSPFAPERLEKETAHLRNRRSVRHLDATRHRGWPWLLVLLVLGLLWLFCMDPVLYSFQRDDAIRDYLYLHNCGSDAKARELAASGVLTPNEVERLDRRIGSFQDYYANSAAADQKADEIIRYMKGLSDLRAGRYESLGTVGKIRYQLFVRFGLIPPVKWNIFTPEVR